MPEVEAEMLDVLEPVEPPEGRIDAPTVCAQCDVRVSCESVGSRGQNVVRQRDVELEADRARFGRYHAPSRPLGRDDRRLDRRRVDLGAELAIPASIVSACLTGGTLRCPHAPHSAITM